MQYHIYCSLKCKNDQPWAVVVSQLVERLLPIPEICGSNPVIGYYFLSNAFKRRK